MRATIALATAALFASVQAHFQLQYPAPRGVFVEDDEPTPCDGYKDVNTTRTSFPLGKGVVALNSEHSKWNIAAVISTKTSPLALTDFNTAAGALQFAIPASTQNGEGVYCLPIDISQLGLPDVKDGTNVTLQFIFDGGDDKLYQCADITLSSSAQSPSDADLKCKDAVNVPSASAIGTATSTGSGSSTASGSSSTATSPSSAGSSTGSSPTTSPSSAASVHAPVLSGVFGVIGLALAAF